MTTLAANKQRVFEQVGYESYQDLPIIAADTIYEGAAVGDNGSGLARPLVAADPFYGFAVRKCANESGAASADSVRVQTKGHIVLAVTGVASADDVGTTVYAADDDSFTLTAGSNTSIGKVARWISSTTCVVAFEAGFERSL